ncbi:antibiotic biosynthesis monooxygenase [Deinococcus deserti]|uniref:ABM domain-containing protein n=1 Tax=Deinococcus deserti (strain DSM 17065 / CIP 109153 / LMG 22923 / VCD115) TaxID=546414 RepID=C1CWU3_DEIDV|nr:antibiotic biosynthesis monooxygenase [Deinococcus deserti]ACO46660.1 hypothetical protein Deide_16880 [Deinococcus deserti VCD115]
MILEIARPTIRPGQTAAFETAFREAQQIIRGMSGSLRHELQQCLEDDHRYALLVWWETLEAHTMGFRSSTEYQQWRALMHHFYDPFPAVEHFVAVAGVPA